MSATADASLEDTARYCLAIVEFLNSVTPLGEIRTGFVQAVAGAVAKKRWRALQSMRKECVQWADQTLSGIDKARLEALLVESFGKGLAGDGNDEDRVRKVLERGTIRTAAEFRLLAARLERMIEEGPTAADVSKINTLLAAYEAKQRRG